MDARTLEFLRSKQRIIAFVDRYPELQQLTSESTAFALYRDAVTALENWETTRQTNEMEIRHLRVKMQRAKQRLFADLACVEIAGALTPLHVAPLPKFAPPPQSFHVERITAAVAGLLTVAREHEQTLIASGMHPRKLDDVETSAQEFAEAHFRWAQAEAFANFLPNELVRLKDLVRGRYEQLYRELCSAMTFEARSAWKQTAALGRKHRDNVILLPSNAEHSREANRQLTTGVTLRRLATRAVRRVIGAD